MHRAAALVALAGATIFAQSPSPYRVTHTYVIGGDGS